jgi:predicted  nucleic acid-binding Zn-ribbon protein
MFTIRMRLAPTILMGMLTLPAALTAQTEERSQTQGIKETEKFVKAGRATTQAVEEGKLQAQKTLEAYNTLVTQPSKDMKGDYKRVLKGTEAMNDKVAKAREKVEAMQKARDIYFSGRTEAIKNIQDPALQKQAQERLAGDQKQFAGVLEALQEGGKALEPFRKQLADQITYLGSDLNPSAVNSLKPQATKLNAQGTEVFAKVDQATAKANAYFQGLTAAS